MGVAVMGVAVTDVINWLLRLDTLRPGQEGVAFTLTVTPEPWQWALIGAACIGLAGWSYSHLEGSGRWRAALAMTRALLLLLVVFLLCGPRLVRPTETVEKDWVLVLVDRSGSMKIADAEPAGPAGTGVNVAASGASATREEQLADSLARSRVFWEKLGAERVVVWLGFDAGAFELKPGASADGGAATVATPTPAKALPVTLDVPAGRRSAIGGAIEAALARSAARPLAGIVILSDGRATDQISRATLRRLKADRVPIFSVPLGSSLARTDFAVRGIEAPTSAFAADIVPVRARVERFGSLNAGASAKLRLVDEDTGKTLDERSVRFEPGETAPAGTGSSGELTLTARPGANTPAGAPDTTRASERRWSVRLVTETPDLLPENNRADLSIATFDRPLRVLYLDGYPRWEYRYLKNVLSREKSVSFASTLLAVGRRYLQEGNETLDAIPSTPSEWARFDVIMLGDLRPDVFTTQQLSLLRDRVSIGGAGLMWIAGEGAVPTAWRSTVLADLLPMSFASGDASIRSWDQEVYLRPTPNSEGLGVLRLLDERAATAGDASPRAASSTPGGPAISQPLDGAPFWPGELSDGRNTWSRLRWVQRIDPASLKPAVETLAVVEPSGTGASPAPADGDRATSRRDASATPAVMTMRFGAGRIVYVATDEIWRYRYGRGEAYPERFYLQLLRYLGRDSVGRAGRAATLAISPRRASVAQPVRVSVQLVDQSLIEASPASITVRIDPKPVAPSPGATPAEPRAVGESVTLTLRPEGTGANAPSEAGRRSYVATWVPSQPGVYRASLVDPLFTGLPEVITADAEVTFPDDELRQPETDHPLLAQLATETGGSVVPPADLASLGNLLPRREIRTSSLGQEHPLWDTPAALLAIILLLTIEWVARRLLRLA